MVLPFRIMGIDPGANCAGFVILETKKPYPVVPRDFSILDAGALRTKATLTHAEKLGGLHESIFNLAHKWEPSIGVIEKAFVGINNHSALRLGEARGALVAALRRLKIPVAELSPTVVKKTIAGNGHASKEMLYQILKIQLKFELGHLPLDVSDAIAIGLSYGLTTRGPETPKI